MREIVGSICFTCLSTNRNLLPIKEHNSSTLQNWTKVNVTGDCKICWECAAIFRRIENFKIQVLNASTLFNKLFQQETMTFATLSKLTYVTNDTFDNIYHDTMKEVTYIFDNDDTVGDNIKCEWKETKESPNNSNDTVYSGIDSNEHIDDTFKAFSAIENVKCDYGNVSVNDKVVVHDYNEIGAVPNHFLSDINISNPFATFPGESIDCVVPKNVDGSKIKTEFDLLEVEVPSLNVTNCDYKKKTKKTQTSKIKNRSEKSKETKAISKTFTKMNNVKVCDRYKMLVVSEEEMMKERQKEKESDKYVKSTYKCENCILGYTNEVQYLNHRTNFHSETLKMKCPICECTFADATSLEVHKKDHCQIYQCSECTYRRIRMNRVLDHYGKHHLNQEFYTCSKCHMKFGSKSKLIHHRSKAHRPLAACETCGKEFSTKQCLKKHMLQHTGMPQYECGFCNKYYKGKTGLASHMRYAHSDRKSEEAYCTICDVQFKGVYTYKIHLKTAHVPYTSERVQCDECGKQIKKSSLSKHIKFMHSSQPIQNLPCNICSKTFRRSSNLRMHIQEVHEKKQTVNSICEICAKPFRTKFRLREHLNTHTGLRPYKCDICSSTFKHHGALYTHIKLVHYKMKRSWMCL